MKRRNSWHGAFSRGLRFISSHKPHKALGEFERALDKCPVNKSRELGRILYYTGFALERLGQESLAAKSWINAGRIAKTRTYIKYIARWVNVYGMRRKGCTEADDYSAFISIQTKKYLQQRDMYCFASMPEQDMVYALIDDAWKLLSRSGILRPLSPEQKLALFQRARVQFPLLHTDLQNIQPREPISANFTPGAAFTPQGLPCSHCNRNADFPFQMCRGRP